MSRLKSTVKIQSDFGTPRGVNNKSNAFVFSCDLLDWMYADNPYGKIRRKLYLEEKRMSAIAVEKSKTDLRQTA
jgi:hypothetical protein